jgi:nucleoside-diphosphate-sugar epimerase
MRTVLCTGATGFLGSALVANLLAGGTRVKTLSRADPGGARVRAAILRAARGFGLELAAEHLELLTPVQVDFQDLPGTLPPRVLQDVTEVWNAAGETSYSLGRILQSVDQNVVATSTLYDLTARHAPCCQRFYQVSTAYTAGLGVEDVRETVHFTPQLINSYQLTKWIAEANLLQHHRDKQVPVTLFRPSLLIGHQHTGWSTGASVGLFALAEALLRGQRQGATHLRLDVRAETRPNLVCIDTVVRRALGLLRAEAHRRPTEIFHCVGDQLLTLADALEPAWRQLGLSVAFGPPWHPVDTDVHRLVEKHQRLANKTWYFRTDKLQRVLGAEYGRQPMTPDITRRSLAHFLAHRLQRLAQEAGDPTSPGAPL